MTLEQDLQLKDHEIGQLLNDLRVARSQQTTIRQVQGLAKGVLPLIADSTAAGAVRRRSSGVDARSAG